MDNPLVNIKIFITNSINSFLKEKFIDETDLTYNHKRKLFQSTVLFSKSKKTRSDYINKLEHFNSNNFELLIQDNYINFNLSIKAKQKFMFKFIKYLQSIPRNLTPINYFIYYKKQENLYNIKTKAFMDAQLNLIRFYGYSPNVIFKKDLTCKNQVQIDFELDNITTSYKINSFFNNKLLQELFSPKFLNLLILSKNINTTSYTKKILKKLNTKNPFYITAYVIAKLNRLKPVHLSDINKVVDQETINVSFLLAETLSNYKNALSIRPLLNILNEACEMIFVNNFYNFDIERLFYNSIIINFLTNISQTTFLYY